MNLCCPPYKVSSRKKRLMRPRQNKSRPISMRWATLHRLSVVLAALRCLLLKCGISPSAKFGISSCLTSLRVEEGHRVPVHSLFDLALTEDTDNLSSTQPDSHTSKLRVSFGCEITNGEYHIDGLAALPHPSLCCCAIWHRRIG